jgi:alanine racemase
MSYIQINKANYLHNLSYLVAKLGDIGKLMVVLKDNAYGHGLIPIAKIASEFGINKAAVKNLSEANQVLEYFDEILILADHPPKIPIDKKISFAVHSFHALENFLPNTNIHISLDTGMHRNGICEEEIKNTVAIIKDKSLNLKGVFTHFRSSDELSSSFFWQEKNYQKMVALLKEEILTCKLQMPLFHSCNSSAFLRKNTPIEDDYVRCGIATYGYPSLDESFGNFDLKPVLSLWAEKLSSRVLRKGQKIGYGGIYQAKCDEIISTYDIGYGDGFFRYDGFGDLKTTDNESIVGRLSMDSLFVKSDKESVCLFDDANALAKHFKTITYEITTKLSPFIKRVVV